MSTDTPTGNNSPVTTADSTVAQSVQSFVSVVTDALASADADDDAVATVEQAGEAVVSRVDQLEARVEDTDHNVAALETEVEENTDEIEATQRHSGRERADLSSRVADLEDDVDGLKAGEDTDVSGPTPTPDAGETPSPSPKTALEDVVQVPEPLVEESMTANQERARFVAKDVVDYARSVPKGYALTASELRQVLTARSDDSGKQYTQTVSRVIEYLDNLGEDAVEVTETMGGQRTVVFDEDLVKRLVAFRNAESNTVVAGNEVGG